MHSHRKSNNSNTPPHHQNCTINTFFSSLYRSARDDSLPLPLLFFCRLLLLSLRRQRSDYICAFITQLYFPRADLKLCLAVCHHSALLPQQPESVNRLLRLILCSGGCQTVMLWTLVDLGNSWQPSQIINVKILQVELEINTNHRPVVIVL